MEGETITWGVWLTLAIVFAGSLLLMNFGMAEKHNLIDWLKDKKDKKVLKLLRELGKDDVERTYWTTETKTVESSYHSYTKEVRTRASESDALLVSSLCENGLHAPVLDIDLPAKLVPSSTEGHYHLYIDKLMTWGQYKKLLRALYEAGIIEKGFYESSIARKQAFARKPGVKKNS